MSWKNHAVAGGLAVCAVVAVAGTVITAPVRQVDRTVSSAADQGVAQQAWGGVDSSGRSVVAAGMVSVPTQHGVQVLSAVDGRQAWHYERRDRDLCALSRLGESFVVTFRGPGGCGETTLFEAKTGKILQQRSSLGPAVAYPLWMGSSKAGLVSPQRVETWGSNLVRLTEYGDVEAPAEAGYQPNPGCEILSAEATDSVVALTERCEQAVMLRVIAAQSSDSRKPEVRGEYTVDSSSTAAVVAVSDAAVVVYAPGRLIRFAMDSVPAKKGSVVTLRVAEEIPLEGVDPSVVALGVADVVSRSGVSQWWDGHRTWIFEGKELTAHSVEGTLGTGAIVAGQVVVPVREGLVVVDPASGAVVGRRGLAAAREAGTTQVDVSATGTMLVEERLDASGGRTVWGFPSS